MKKCKDCFIEKPRSEFYGVQNECKECTKKRVKENLKRNGNAYYFSEIGVLRTIYSTQKSNQKKRGHGSLPYTKKELSEWMHDNGFVELYLKWKKSGFSSKLKPSVDRIDDSCGYSFCNIRLVTWGENRVHQASDIINAVGPSGSRCKKVLKMNENMEIIREYKSFSEARRCEGYSMEYPIKNGTRCKNGYFWSYHNNHGERLEIGA